MEYKSSGEEKRVVIYILFLKYSIMRIISQEARIQMTLEGIWCVAAFWEALEMNCVYVNGEPNTNLRLSPPLLIYLSWSGGSEPRVHFIPSWRKDSGLHSGVPRDGVLSLCPMAKLPNAMIF